MVRIHSLGTKYIWTKFHGHVILYKSFEIFQSPHKPNQRRGAIQCRDVKNVIYSQMQALRGQKT